MKNYSVLSAILASTALFGAALATPALAATQKQLYDQSVFGELDWDAYKHETQNDSQTADQEQDPNDPSAEPGESNEIIDMMNNGASDQEIADAVAAMPNATANPRMFLHVFMAPQGINVQREFVVIVVDGKIRRISLISTGRAGRPTALYDGPAKFPYCYKGGKGCATNQKLTGDPFSYAPKGLVPYPFIQSNHPEWPGATMYWGLHMTGGFWAHATPHASELGRPASGGCTRLSLPTAMEVWDAAVNEVKGSVHIKIYKPGSQEAINAYNSLKIDREVLRQQLDQDMADANRGVNRSGDYTGNVQPRIGQALVIPKCANEDCFSFFAKKVNNLVK